MADAPKRRKLERKPNDPVQFTGTQKFYCVRCGTAYSRQKGYFPVSHSPMYRGTGYLPICNECVEDMYDRYKAQLGGDREAMRRMCMKLDLYWNDSIFDMTERTAGINSKVRNYIGKTNIARFINKNFDDTIDEGGAIVPVRTQVTLPQSPVEDTVEQEEEEPVPEEIVARWGSGYTAKMYADLEQRRQFWLSQYPEDHVLDVAEEALIQQICGLEIDIKRDRVAGKPTDKSVNTLNTLLGSAGLKPSQKTDEGDSELDNMPFGVGVRRYENTRPIPEPDPELRDVDGIVRYISVWFLGHLCKMLGIKNTYCKLYEDEMEKLRVKLPEFEDEEEDDESLFNTIFGDQA